MQRSNLPLNAIRAFEATVRLGSVTAAAAELHVTQGAVSRHVKKLEMILGVALVYRDQHTIQPTATGHMLATKFTESLNLITEAIADAVEEPEILRLQVSPTFANRWLIPRLEELAQVSPQLELALTTTLANDRFDSQSFDRHSFDAGIVYGRDEDWEGLEKRLLLKEVVIPISAPSLSNGEPAPKKYEDLEKHMLLHAKIDHSDWSHWLSFVGEDDIRFDTGPSFETMDLAIAAAERGFGVTLGNLLFIKSAIDSGNLVLPFGPAMHTGYGYYLVYPKDSKITDAVAQCIKWICDTSPEANDTIENLVKELKLSKIANP